MRSPKLPPRIERKPEYSRTKIGNFAFMIERGTAVRVTRIRRKIEADPAHPQYIRTVRGEGYLFNPRGEAQ